MHNIAGHDVAYRHILNEMQWYRGLPAKGLLHFIDSRGHWPLILEGIKNSHIKIRGEGKKRKYVITPRGLNYVGRIYIPKGESDSLPG